jgi:hypothetical protein
MKGIIDRFEGEYAVIEIEGKTKDVNRNIVDEKVKINDAVIFIDGKWFVDHQATALRKKKIQSLMDQIWGN